MAGQRSEAERDPAIHVAVELVSPGWPAVAGHDSCGGWSEDKFSGP